MNSVADDVAQIPVNELSAVIDLSVARYVDRVVPALVKTEEDRRFRQLKWIIAFIGLVGLGTFGTLANFLIDKSVDSRIAIVRNALELSQLHTRVVALETKDGFSPEAADLIMRMFRRTANDTIARTDIQFQDSLRSTIRAFASADEGARVDELMSMFSQEALASPSTVELLLNHYGQEVVGRPTTPKGDDRAMTRFEQAEAVADDHGVESVALHYRILIEEADRISFPADATAAYLDRASSLDSDDRAFMYRLFIRHSCATSWMTKVTPQGKRIQDVSQDLVRRHAAAMAAGANLAEPKLLAMIDEC